MSIFCANLCHVIHMRPWQAGTSTHKNKYIPNKVVNDSMNLSNLHPSEEGTPLANSAKCSSKISSNCFSISIDLLSSSGIWTVTIDPSSPCLSSQSLHHQNHMWAGCFLAEKAKISPIPTKFFKNSPAKHFRSSSAWP